MPVGIVIRIVRTIGDFFVDCAILSEILFFFF